MSQKELFSKEVILSNGATIGLADAVGIMGLLEEMVADPGERRLLHHLREACLGRAGVPDGHRKALTDLALLRPDGSVDPKLRQVVLAAVHGHGEAIFLTSPFTDAWDKTVAELIASRVKVRRVLHPEEAEVFISSQDLGHANTIDGLRKWADQVPKRRGDLPPPSRN